MFRKFSIKTKIIIFTIASIIAILIIINEGMSNNNSNRNNSIEKINKESINNKEVIEKKSTNNKDTTDKKSVTNEENKSISEKKLSKVEKKSSNLEEKYKSGYIAFHNGKYEEAIKIENEVIKEDKNFYKAYSIKGIATCFNGDYENGMKFIDKSLDINMDYGYGRFNKALAYELYGYYDKALSWYDKALEIENYIWSYYGKASIYGRRGDSKNTVKYLKIAINMDLSVKNLIKEERDFDNVRKNEEFKELLN